MKSPSQTRTWLILALGVGVLSWVVVPRETAERVVSPVVRDAWTLPEIRRWSFPPSAAVKVAEAAFWGPQIKAVAEEANAPAADPRWRLAGVVGPEGSRRVLVVFNDPKRPQQLLGHGENLPSGHRIARIEERQVCVQIGKRAYTLPIERLDLAQ